MEPTTPNSSKGGRPKKIKSFRGSTSKQKIVPKCTIAKTNIDEDKTPPINTAQEIPNNVVSINTIANSNERIAFLCIISI